MKKFLKVILGTALCAAQFAALCAAADTYSYLPVERRMLFNKWEETPPGGVEGIYDFGHYDYNWTHTPDDVWAGNLGSAKRLLAGTNHVHTSGWQVFNGFTGTAVALGQKQIVPPAEYAFSDASAGIVHTNWAANLQNFVGAAVQSPVYNDGIGVLYFDAANVFTAVKPTVEVQFATNKVTASNGYLPINYGSGTLAWNTVTNFIVEGVGRYAIPINITSPVTVRIRRADKSLTLNTVNTYYLAVDNICVSYPHGKLTVETPIITKVSGQPTSAYIACTVSNLPGLPGALKTDNTKRSVTVYYTGGDGTYLSAKMDYKAGTGSNGDGEEYFATVEFPNGSDTEKITAYCVANDTFDCYLPVDYTESEYYYWDTADNSEPPPAFASEARTVDVSNWSLANVVTALPVERRMLFNKWEEQDVDTGLPVLTDLGDYFSAAWVHSGPAVTGVAAKRRLLNGTNHVHSAGWLVNGGWTGTSVGVSGKSIVEPEFYNFTVGSASVCTNWAANLANAEGVSIESPVYTDGIGTIYFDAVNNLGSVPVTLKLQVATNMVDRAYSYTQPIDMMADHEYDEVDSEDETLIHEYRYYWIDADEIILDQNNIEGKVLRYQKIMQYRDIIKFRLVRVDKGVAAVDAAFAVVDNIQVSPPPSDVVVYDDDMTFVPPYPAPGEPFRIRCRVKNVDMNVPTDHSSRSLTVFYRWRYLDQKVNDWASMTMSYVPEADGDDGAGNGELYEAGIAGQEMEGDLEYYFVCNFDGYRYKPTDYTQTGYKYLQSNPEVGTESLSPRNLRSDSGKEFSLRIRKATTNYKQLYIVTDKHTEPIEMTLMDNETWWGWIPLNVGALSIDSFRFNFMGIGGYDAATQMTNAVPTYWAEVGQGAAATPPSGGVCVEATQTDRMAIECENAHYALVRFEIGTGNYTICKADYQNFNTWVANDTVFSDYSDFAESARKVSSNTTFEAWTHSEDDAYSEYFIGFPETALSYSRAFVTFKNWYAAAAKYEKEIEQADANNRPSSYTTEDQYQNIAVRMIGSNSLLINTDNVTELGSICTLPESLTDGIKTISFKSRLGTGVDPSRITFFNKGWDAINYGNLYRIQAAFTVSSDGPGERSISIIGGYRDDGNFVEGRLVLVANTKNLKNPHLRMELHNWTDGVDRTVTTQLIEGNTQSLSGRVLALDFTAGNVVFSQGTGGNETKLTGAFSSATIGTFGFMSSDCSVSVGQLYYNKAGSTSARMDISSNDWATRSGLWKASGSMLQMTEKTQKVGVFVQKTKYNSGARPDMSITEWELVDTVSLNGFTYHLSTITLEHWQAEFVRLQVLPGDYDVVVDELHTTSWHGKQYPEGSSAALNMQWLVTEGWIQADTANSANTVVRLDLTRASLNDDAMYAGGQTQGIRTPLLVDGCGSLEFDCRVPRGPVRLTVQYTGRWTTDWQDCKTVELPANNNWTHYSFYIGNTNGGYMRVVNDRRRYGNDNDEVYYSKGIVEFNNMTAWNEPYVDSDSWYAYNAKVTDHDADRLILDATRGCYLNNSQSAEASPLQDQHQPHLQTPLLAGGLGEICFDARPYNKGETAKVYIYGTAGDWYGPDSDWELLDTIDVTGDWFSTYRWGAGQNGSKYKAVRLQTTTTGGKRVCLENVSVSEPVFPGFDISATRPICQNSDYEYNLAQGQQPLASDKVGIEARLSNMRMSPSNIEVYVCYYVGTNVWGVSNYRNTGERRILKMYQAADDPQIYRTSPDADLGYFDAGDVIQYYVYATYTDAEGLTSYYEEQSDFTNPSWYEPMNLNTTMASQGWTPYFLIYDIPKGTVFINEINVYELTSLRQDTENCVYAIPYVEVAMPEEIDIQGWNLLFVDAPDRVLDHGTTTNRIVLASTASKTAVTNGYSFWVVSVDKPVSNYGLPTAPKYIDQSNSALRNYMLQWSTIALMLQRPSGIVEQVLTFRGYTDTNGYADELADSDPYKRAISLGGEIADGSLSVLTNNGFTATDWKPAIQWTPGLPNVDQVMPAIPQVFPGVSNVVVTGTLNNYSLATQNGSSRKITFKVGRNASTNIIYECAEWYRVLSVTTNGVPVQLPEGGATNRVYKLDLPNLTQAVEVAATVGLSYDLTKQNLGPDVLNWVMQYGDGSIVESTFNGKPMTLTELYWFNANPTIAHVFLGENVALEKDDNTNHWLTIQFTIDGNNCTSLWGGATLKLKMRKSLTEEELSSGTYKDGWRFLSQYAIMPDSFDENHRCRIYVPYEYLLRKAPDWDLSDIFLIWRIQFDEESDYILPLVNTPKE